MSLEDTQRLLVSGRLAALFREVRPLLSEALLCRTATRFNSASTGTRGGRRADNPALSSFRRRPEFDETEPKSVRTGLDTGFRRYDRVGEPVRRVDQAGGCGLMTGC